MPKIPRHQIAQVLAERSLGSVNAKSFGDEIAAYLAAEHRTAELEPLLRDIMQYRAEHGIVEVIASSAHALTAANRRAVEAQVKQVFPSAKHIIIAEVLQPTLIGGIRLELPNQQIDMSVRSTLSRFKQLTTAGR